MRKCTAYKIGVATGKKLAEPIKKANPTMDWEQFFDLCDIAVVEYEKESPEFIKDKALLDNHFDSEIWSWYDAGVDEGFKQAFEEVQPS